MFPFFKLGGFNFPTFPFVIMIAIFSTGVNFFASKKYSKLYSRELTKKFCIILIFAALGARLLFAITVVPTSEKPFWYNFLYGGAVFYGGIIGGCIGLALSCIKNRQPFLEYTDVLVSLLPFGHAIGRIGCFLNGCCYGSEYNGFFSINYPVNGEIISVFPTWFVEAGFCMVLFVYFQFLCKTNIRGIRTAIYFISYSVYRFCIEFLRGDEIRGVFEGISTSQIISIFTLLFGVIVLALALKRNKKNYLIIAEG